MSSRGAPIVKRKRAPSGAPRIKGQNVRTASLPSFPTGARRKAPNDRATAASRGRARVIRSGRTKASTAEVGEQYLDDEEANATTPEDSGDESEDSSAQGVGTPHPDKRSSGTPAEATVISSSPEPEYMLAELIEEPNEREQIEASEPQIPPKLLTRLLYHHVQDGGSKIAKDANMLVAKYIDVFVREAIARATHERREKYGSSIHGIDNFLEVEDLEKSAPQLVLDF